jgi:hypothetical protein
MSLKTKQGTESVSDQPMTGPWGRIVYDHQLPSTIRFQKMDKWRPVTYSYPYRGLSRWEYRHAHSGEEIVIQAVADTVTITGKNLERLAEALDQGTLALVREMGDEFGLSDSPIRISSIIVKGTS